MSGIRASEYFLLASCLGKIVPLTSRGFSSFLLPAPSYSVPYIRNIDRYPDLTYVRGSCCCLHRVSYLSRRGGRRLSKNNEKRKTRGWDRVAKIKRDREREEESRKCYATETTPEAPPKFRSVQKNERSRNRNTKDVITSELTRLRRRGRRRR